MSVQVVDLSRHVPDEVKRTLKTMGIVELYLTFPAPGAAIVFTDRFGILLTPLIPFLPNILFRIL